MSEDKSCCTDKNKLKILCIHGYRQNGEVFRQKTGSFRKMVHKWADFTFVSAPHKVLLVNTLEEDEINIQQSPDTGIIKSINQKYISPTLFC